MSLAEFQALRHEKLGYPDVPVPQPREWGKLSPDYKPVEHNVLMERDLKAWKKPDLDAAWERTKRLSIAKEVTRDPVSLRPLNPHGATGISGLGRLRDLGPNFTADGLVTIGSKVLIIERRDTGQLAFPGGFLEKLSKGSYENPLTGAIREVEEETELKVKGLYETTLLSMGATALSLRNTDNAWIENTAYHIELYLNPDNLPPVRGGDDAAAARWYDINDLDLTKMSDTHAQNAQLLQAALLN